MRVTGHHLQGVRKAGLAGRGARTEDPNGVQVSGLSVEHEGIRVSVSGRDEGRCKDLEEEHSSTVKVTPR